MMSTKSLQKMLTEIKLEDSDEDNPIDQKQIIVDLEDPLKTNE